MAWLSHTPNVLSNTGKELVIEESHFSRLGIVVVGVFLSSFFVIPAILSGSLLGAIISLVLGGFIVGLPFLIVLLISRYRRLEIDFGNEIRSTSFNTFLPAKSIRFSWAEIDRIVYQRRRDSHPHRLGRLRLTLHTKSGTQHRILRGWYSEELKVFLQQRLGSLFEYEETRLPW